MFVKKSIFVGFILLALSVLALPPSFAQAELIGRYREISGPLRLKYLGIARTNQAYQLMEMALERKQIEMALRNFDVTVIKNHTEVCVLDVELFENRAKVLVLEGLQQGTSGWVPLAWLEGNYQKARLWQNH